MESQNRSTVYDWQKMLYRLYKIEGLTPEEISDLYVNMCPRGWRETDGDCSYGADLPLRRLLYSAYDRGTLVEVVNQLDQVEH